MNTLAPYSQDQLATKYGGWAMLCDPKFILMDELYSDFEAAGLSKSEFNKMREEQKMPARQRVMLDVAEDLVRIWVRYWLPELRERHIHWELRSPWTGTANTNVPPKKWRCTS